jgi:hypothetical protein
MAENKVLAYMYCTIRSLAGRLIRELAWDAIQTLNIEVGIEYHPGGRLLGMYQGFHCRCKQ